MDARFIPFLPDERAGLAFALRDLRLALAWAASQTGVHLHVRWDRACINEIIEISPSASSVPRWHLWRTYEGNLRVDDWAEQEFGLPYLTVAAALAFITTQL